MSHSKYEFNYTFDLPVDYRGLKLYPVVMKDYLYLASFSDCLMLEKNSIEDPQTAVKAIRMTYFEFLMYVTNDENKLMQHFDALLRLVLNKQGEDYPIIYSINPKDSRPIFKIGETIYDSSDVDNLRIIIAEQNMLDIPDERIQKNVRKRLEEARRYKAKLAGDNKMGGLEDQILALAIYTGWSLDDIYKLTVRKFTKALNRANHMIVQDHYLSASLNGFVEFKDKSVIRSWLANIDDDDKNSDVIMELDELKDKIK